MCTTPQRSIAGSGAPCISAANLIHNKGTEMTKLLTALGTASLLALTACGGGSEAETNNVAATDDVTLPADENVVGADTPGDQANALDTTNATSDANLSLDANLSGDAVDANASANVTNSQ
jgi:hypothetical protein